MNIFYYHITDIFYLILYQLKIIAPYWIGGILLGGIISAYFSDQLASILSKTNSSRHLNISILLGAAVGAISPVTMHGMVPVVLVLHKKGMSDAVLAGFVVTSVLINPNVFVYSFALGADIAFIRLGVTVLAGWLAGLLTKLLIKDTIFNPDKNKPLKSKDNKKHIHALKVMLKTIKKTGPYLLLGILLTALFEKFIPKNIFENVFAQSVGLGALLGSALGVPLYFCGGGSIALIMSWMSHGMSAGSVMAFIVAGPATKINNLTAIAAMLKRKYLILYLVYIITFSVIIGTVIDLVL